VDLVVANAGAGTPTLSLWTRASGRLIAANLTAPIELTRALLPAMLERGGTGCATSPPSPAGPACPATRCTRRQGGLDVRRQSAHGLNGTGVRVGVFVPGVIATAFFERRAARTGE
jgi:short-subunit dehydrogenase